MNIKSPENGNIDADDEKSPSNVNKEQPSKKLRGKDRTNIRRKNSPRNRNSDEVISDDELDSFAKKGANEIFDENNEIRAPDPWYNEDDKSHIMSRIVDEANNNADSNKSLEPKADNKDISGESNDNTIDINKYVKKPKFGSARLTDGCFLNNIKMLPLLVPDNDKGEDISDIIGRFTDKDNNVFCEQLDTHETVSLYLPDFAAGILAELAPEKNLVLTKNIVLLSGASNLFNGYNINGRCVETVLDGVYRERSRLKGWLKLGGVDAYDYISTVDKPANLVSYGLEYHNLLNNKRNRSIYSSSVLVIAVNKFRDAFGSDTISNVEVISLFVLSAYTMYPNQDPRIKKLADKIIYYFLANLEEMDLHLKKLRKDGEIPR